MALKLMYITNREDIAKIAEGCGVDWIFIDLEINGKEERQGHLDAVISRHSLDDIKKVKQVLTQSELLVRVNPIYDKSKEEIDRVISSGADIIMLPYFKTKKEVETFLDYVGSRTKSCLLLETPEAVENIDSILTIQGIDYIHIGLNDLHLGYHKRFMFELLSDGTVEILCSKIRNKGIPYGFGGIAQLGKGTLPAENIIAEHYRLGSTMAILSRSFCNVGITTNLDDIKKLFLSGVQDIRNFEIGLASKSEAYYALNQESVYKKVTQIVNSSK